MTKKYELYKSNNSFLDPKTFFISSSWDDKFLNLALHVAGWSKDPRTKVGCVIANGKNTPELGYNGFPAGVTDTEERYDDYDLKHKLTLHAEQNAIANAFRKLDGDTLYVTYPPCIRCTMQIISENIKRVVTLKSSEEKMKKHKVDMDLSMSIFLEAGVRYDIYQPKEKKHE